MSLAMTQLSRRYEFEADKFAQVCSGYVGGMFGVPVCGGVWGGNVCAVPNLSGPPRARVISFSCGSVAIAICWGSVWNPGV